jgi:hypothetical protein
MKRSKFETNPVESIENPALVPFDPGEESTHRLDTAESRYREFHDAVKSGRVQPTELDPISSQHKDYEFGNEKNALRYTEQGINEARKEMNLHLEKQEALRRRHEARKYVKGLVDLFMKQDRTDLETMMDLLRMSDSEEDKKEISNIKSINKVFIEIAGRDERFIDYYARLQQDTINGDHLESITAGPEGHLVAEEIEEEYGELLTNNIYPDMTEAQLRRKAKDVVAKKHAKRYVNHKMALIYKELETRVPELGLAWVEND